MNSPTKNGEAMATATKKKTTAKKTQTASTTGKRTKAKTAKAPADLGDVFKETAESDREDAVTRKVNPFLKEMQAHLEEALLYVRAARKSTATHEAQAACVKIVGEIMIDVTDLVGACTKVVA